MATQSAESHNPSAISSGKRAIPLAAKVARELGLVPTWPNLQTIRLAIESEAEFFSVSVAEIAEMLVRAGKERTRGPQYGCPSEWERRDIFRMNTVDRFWFEDARYRMKFAYAEFETDHRKAETAPEPGEQIA